ncbi:MAG TPA: DUF2076 domain-containing protein [Bryobacteraceae bacterium]|jgi:hypothetical protein|nr:DUF2076 domain-containing protein [Bryobacteraceae bacterium]
MTQDERNMISDLANKIAQTPTPPKDPEAEEFIRTKIGSRPDALYLMTQTVLIQNLALQHAQQQIQELQQRAGTPQVSGGGSFLGQNAPPPRSGYGQGSQYSAPQAQYAPPPQYSSAPQGGPSGGGFLRGAAQTAAGVAAGGLAFEAINSLFHSGGGGLGGFGGGGFGGSGYAGAPVEETVVNNYYDQPGDSGGFDDSANVDNSQLDDSNYDSGDDGGSFDDNSGGDNFS